MKLLNLEGTVNRINGEPYKGENNVPLTYKDALVTAVESYMGDNKKESIKTLKLGLRIHGANGELKLEDHPFELLNKVIEKTGFNDIVTGRLQERIEEATDIE